MAKRTLSRKQLRAEAEQAERAAGGGEAPAPPGPAKPAKPAKPARGARKPSAKMEPVRLRAFWGVFDNAMKRVATFAYNERAAAELKLASLNEKKAGRHFLQVVKEPMAAPAGDQGG
jgi:hypothetical protein